MEALRGEREKNSDDPFSQSDLNWFLSCVYDLGTGEKSQGHFSKLPFYSSVETGEKKKVFPGGKKKFCKDNFSKLLCPCSQALDQDIIKS